VTAKEAVQVHDHPQLRPDPSARGQPPAFQGPAGQLGQGIGAALTAAAVILGVGRAGQGFQGGQQAPAGLGLQQPIDGDHARPGRGQPQPPTTMPQLGLVAFAVGIGDQP
jgi:hypothetical protein